MFTSYGVLAWLPDLASWGETIARHLKPGGMFLIVEIHPFAQIFEDENSMGLDVRYPYFTGGQAERYENTGTYTDSDIETVNRVNYEWEHPISEIVNAVAGAGMRIEDMKEFPFCCFRKIPCMDHDGKGLWHLPEGTPEVPLLFTLRATKPED